MDDRLSLLEPLWDSGVRRVGQAGARGWGVELQERVGEQAASDREELVQTNSQQLEDDLIASKINLHPLTLTNFANSVQTELPVRKEIFGFSSRLSEIRNFTFPGGTASRSQRTQTGSWTSIPCMVSWYSSAHRNQS